MKHITFNNISFGYSGQQPIFDELSFELRNPHADKGYVIALMGQSGAGKSTLLKLILGTLKLQKGSIQSNPTQPVIAYLPQEPVLFEHLSPLANARYFATTAFYKKRFSEKFFEELVQSLNMAEVLAQSKSVLELSGGQRQRLSLLRALSIQPDFLLLDEPTTGLDAEVKLQFLNKLRELVVKQNLLVVYVTHHKLETELVVDEIVYIAKDAKTQRINQVFQDTVLNFIEKPPIIDAVKVFNYPKPNLIKMKEVNGGLELGSNQDYDFMFCIEDKHIVFNQTIGFDYTIVTANSIYALLELHPTKQYVSINASLLKKSMSKINFEGNILRYGKNGFLSK